MKKYPEFSFKYSLILRSLFNYRKRKDLKKSRTKTYRKWSEDMITAVQEVTNKKCLKERPANATTFPGVPFRTD